MIRLAHIFPDLLRVLIGLAPIIPGGQVLIRLALIIPDLFRVLISVVISIRIRLTISGDVRGGGLNLKTLKIEEKR